MNRSQILIEIKQKCIGEYAKLDNWIHDINHVKRVVKNGIKLSKMENLKSKDTFLVEIACWLHDLGRVGEKMGLVFEKSEHAEISYIRAKKILNPYGRYLGRESVYKVLQAVREHSMAQLIHKDNLVARILQDADRGAGINIIGIYGMMVGSGLVDFENIITKTEANRNLDLLINKLKENNNIEKAIERINLFLDWYYGIKKQKMTGVEVDPLHTDSARKVYRKGLEEVKMVIRKLELRM